ncbi:MAG: DNA primase [Arcanobacterium sp.]|nr:DNA primase [Arcanobacterium sp.]MDY5588803.1 DNA primase [Arcanobacterium sp.]
MAIDPHSAFEALIEAWQEFHAAVMETEDGEAPRVLRAADRLSDAYTVYDDVLFTSYGVEAPFDTFDEDDDIDDIEDFDDADEDFDDDFDVYENFHDADEKDDDEDDR